MREDYRHGRFGHERHHRRHWAGREGARVFDHGDLRLVIMALLAEKPRYGYEIIKALEERVGEGYSPSPGVVYPTLTLLEEVGHATVSEEHGGRRLYTLKDEGKAFLEANRATVDAILARIAESAPRRGAPPQVRRAFENLFTAVRLRVRNQPLTEAQVRAIADVLDAAAKSIEQT
ncbi:MAG TPA: PadR family transcriptional regulator [Roseiarcus sp.]|nr:PadR family transcriptional regulator [Roseiarcus sp.]